MTNAPEKESIYTALGRAIRLNSTVELEAVLCRVEGSPEKGDVLKWTALMLAASGGKIKIAQWLIAEGADVNKKTQHGHAPLLLAAGKGRVEMVRLLLDSGADVNVTDEGGATALMIAAGAGNEELLELLLQRGAGTGMRDAQGRSAEKFAEQEGWTAVAELLRGLRTNENHESAIKKHERLKELARKAMKRGMQP